MRIRISASGVVVVCALAAAPGALAAQREKLEMYVLNGPADEVAQAARGLELEDVERTDPERRGPRRF